MRMYIGGVGEHPDLVVWIYFIDGYYSDICLHTYAYR